MSDIIQIKGYKIYEKQILGEGSYAIVYKGISDSTQEIVAIKVLNKDESNLLLTKFTNVSSEGRNYLEKYRFERVLKVIMLLDTLGRWKLCDSDLQKELKNNKPLDEKTSIEYLYQLAKGFKSLIKEGIMHRDLKPDNIFIKQNKLKIGDFGFAKKTLNHEVEMEQTKVGTPLYMSPQILSHEKYSSKCDIWSLGMVFYRMLHGRTAWTGSGLRNLLENIKKQPLEIKKDLSEKTKDFLRKTLELEEKNRLSWDKLFCHEIFNNLFNKESTGKGEFENKVKMVMNKIRFGVIEKNMNVTELFYKIGRNFKNSEEFELNQNEFYFLLLQFDNTLDKVTANHIFEITDTDHSGLISKAEIETLMRDSKIPIYERKVSIEDVHRKISDCFKRLKKEIEINSSSLFEIFELFIQQNSSSLNLQEFANLLRSTGAKLQDQEIKIGFVLLDLNRSNSIDFFKLKSYYEYVNGKPKRQPQPQPFSNPNPKTGFNNPILNEIAKNW